MPKEDMIEMIGKVTEVLPDSKFRITLENNHNILGYMAGRLSVNRIRVLAGDKVRVEMSPYDLSKGRINYRFLS